MATYDDRWFEVWYSEGGGTDRPNYLLIVSPDEKDSGKIVVIDPRKNNKICFRGKNYDEVCNWLWEEEFHVVEGRVFPDDGY